MTDPRPRGPVVRVEPSGVELEVEPGETIIEAAWRLGYRWPTICHGQGTCTVCRLEVVRGAEHLVPPGAEEVGALEPLLSGGPRRDLTGVTAAAGAAGAAGVTGVGNLRLACRARVTGDAVVRRKGVRRVQTVTLPDNGLL
ncbi:2Fe-2S iron-sulfur cluster-binding protein [Parafrankia sp. EUN1f]|uniref:2Fe-2S iron-sulfur cluster-binding protein n=1 Tax=Parafrankia sp. EUN1f TaxID=102897 RepID=UPI0001C46852|nr:2Fe-2S iron-sulfur cluster binding domain-containing protein [Parafrankia sp. EUN1f]EFC80759.1 ferredoxin [Parafrankia sp. EUN1f]